MKLTYVSHATLLIETSQDKILTDPWFKGPAFLGQWHVFPKPVDTSFVSEITQLVLTHTHEDHFHLPTLQLLNKDATVYFPYTWKNGTAEMLRSLGFHRIKEVPAFEKVWLSSDISLTFIVNGLDAFVIYEGGGKVFVNLNDALNASHTAFVDIFMGMIRERWQKVDLLICGLGGAGYFPNTIHAAGKDDQEIALLREQFLAHKFCEIVAGLKPSTVFPFVPGFALLEKDKQWINEVRFPRSKLQSYYETHFDTQSQVQFFPLLPGDSIENGQWQRQSHYHSQVQDDKLGHLVAGQYAEAIEAANHFIFQPASVVEELAKGLRKILPLSGKGIASEVLSKVNFMLIFKDIQEAVYIHCYYANGKLKAETVGVQPAEINLTVTTFRYRLRHAIEELWGGDVFYIGYGADIYIQDPACLKDNLDIVSLRLLSRFPSAAHTLRRDPLRALRYLTQNPSFARLALKQKLQLHGKPNKLPFNERSHWINKSKCEVCRLCNIPLLSDEFGEQLRAEK